ncbi:MAG: exo-alpha-sialidase [Phycisphaerae bacterium]|nr:exo-alpha-sialidase [Phycisphaerae bacterium]
MTRLLATVIASFFSATAPLGAADAPSGSEPPYRVAVFSADVTIPIGHACMGGGVADAKEIVDPLYAKGCVLLGPGEPVVVIALDWCQCNNDSYDRWREALAEAAGTSRERVMLATVHQHDAPICDLTAQKLLNEQGLKGWNCDLEFHETAVRRTARALREALASPRPVTHFGIGQAKVERIASNRRVMTPEGKIHWGRGSSSGDMYGAPEGEIDPWLKTISLWDGDRPVVAWNCYAVHPMSHYGRGFVSADFPGMARARRQKDSSGCLQIYFTGCAGDTTAGKYNTGAAENRPILADRLYQAMLAAWNATEKHPLGRVQFRVAKLALPARDTGGFALDAMRTTLADARAGRWPRISAALGLSWRQRVDARHPIDVPCLALGDDASQFMIMPAESFVAYQLTAQRLRPDSFVVVAGFGDGAPGYMPTDQCWRDGYDDNYCWVPPMMDNLMIEAMTKALDARLPTQLIKDVRLDVAKKELSPDFCWFHPRVAAVPAAGRDRKPAVIMTLQKHLRASDHYSGLYMMRTDDLGRTWTGPTEVPELAWRKERGGATIAVADVTPGWHQPTKRVIAIGAQVRYDPEGRQLDDRPRSHQTAYAVYDPERDTWSNWQAVQPPAGGEFNFFRSACSQWAVEPGGTLLVPFYHGKSASAPTSVSVIRCAFDGRELRCLERGDELLLNIDRGFSEPSIVHHRGHWYLTIRSDKRGYVTVSQDGLNYAPVSPWLFDDGNELGSYNTQQHWLSTNQGLFLCYTRRGAGNDHIPRHRAPLFIAQVDPARLRVLRATERVLIPERGAMLGNFGATPITDRESWITDAEYTLAGQPDPRGADGSVFVARVTWTNGAR